ncbi:hypothetical protein [Azospirillum brasilense]|uniref:hypothetical protein n=1 Tax=Azospirillum brasilense TaxID=192 RepID=UPI0020003243|nr:hypothetical protein [Azospirillum brasilense]
MLQQPPSHLPSSHLRNNPPASRVDAVMKIDHDVLLFATRLVEELGESAIRISRVRLVELTAANNLRAAAFWRDVMNTSERLLAERSPSLAPPPTSPPMASPMTPSTAAL